MGIIIKNLINIFLDGFLIVLSLAVPKQQRHLVFGAGDGNLFRGNTKYLFIYLQRVSSSNWHSVWITHNKKVYEHLEKHGLPVVKKYSLKGFWNILRSDFLVMEGATSADIFYSGLSTVGRFRIIQTWHGIGFKTIGLLAIEKGWGAVVKTRIRYLANFLHWTKVSYARMFLFNFYFFLATSTETKRHFEKCFSGVKVVDLGYPRNDVFFSRKLLFENYSQRYALSKFTRVISYVPTYRDFLNAQSNPITNALPHLVAHLEATNSVLLVKRHPYDRTLKLSKCSDRIIDLSEKVDDIQELLVHTDILITDYSSVAFDFLLSKRPIIYFAYDFNEYVERSRSLEYDYFQELPGPFATTTDELIELLESESEWCNSESYKQKYRNLLSGFYTFSDGHSCERFFDYIENERNLS